MNCVECGETIIPATIQLCPKCFEEMLNYKIDTLEGKEDE